MSRVGADNGNSPVPAVSLFWQERQRGGPSAGPAAARAAVPPRRIHAGARPRRMFQGSCGAGRWFPAANGGAAGPAFHQKRGCKQRPRWRKASWPVKLPSASQGSDLTKLRLSSSPPELLLHVPAAFGVTPGLVFKAQMPAGGEEDLCVVLLPLSQNSRTNGSKKQCNTHLVIASSTHICSHSGG